MLCLLYLKCVSDFFGKLISDSVLRIFSIHIFASIISNHFSLHIYTLVFNMIDSTAFSLQF